MKIKKEFPACDHIRGSDGPWMFVWVFEGLSVYESLPVPICMMGSRLFYTKTMVQ